GSRRGGCAEGAGTGQVKNVVTLPAARRLAYAGAVALAVAASAAGVTAQNAPARAANGASGGYTVPRTPWGDPDLQGNYTNLSEAGTPMERPKEYEGRNMNEISPAERARIKKKLAEDTIGRFLGPTEAP